MIVSEKGRFVFVSMPKAGTRSMYAALSKRYGGRRLKGHHHRNDVPLKFRGWFTFSICRNPYDRAVSLWWSTCKRPGDRYGFLKASGGHTFEPFIRWLVDNWQKTHQPMAQPQHTWLKPVRLDRVLRFERLPDEVQALPFWQSGVALPWKNQTVRDRPPASTFITPDTANLVQQWAGEDFERFGYTRNPSEATEA